MVNIIKFKTMKLFFSALCSATMFGFAGLAQGDVITTWNDVLLDTFAQQGTTASPPVNSRTMGMLGGAMFDAVNSVNRNYSAYLGYFDPTTAGSGIDTSAAAAAAAYTVLTSVYTDLYGAGNGYLNTFQSTFDTQLSSIADGEAKTRGIEVGVAAAQAMLSTRSLDGWNSTTNYTPQPLGSPGRWQGGSTTGAWGSTASTFLMSNWGNVTPFTMNSGSEFRPAGMNMGTSMDRTVSYMPFNGNHASWVQSNAYTEEFNQVRTLGGATSTSQTTITRTAEQTEIAYFWVDGPGTASPPGHWNRIAQSISAAQGFTTEQNARLFALLNLAMADAGIASWEAKVFFDTWRPMLAINTADTDGNMNTILDAEWTPLIPTPSFGAYTSGHSAFSMAGATILTEIFGDNYAFTTTAESPFLAPGTERSFSSFYDAAEEAGMSRIYGGIHFMSANVNGLDSGRAIGVAVAGNLLRPVAACDGDEDDIPEGDELD